MKAKNSHILLVEDDESLGFVISDNLKENEYNVHWVQDGQEALDKFFQSRYDLIILDVMLPKIDGFTLAEKFRSENQGVPILFLSAKSLLEDRLEGLRKGGDDYLTKPFSMEELLLKIEIFLKRSESGSFSKLKVYKIGKYTFVPDELKLNYEGEEILLTKKEVMVLLMFCENKGTVLKREDILEKVWGSNDYFLGRSLDVFISKLRKHLKKDPDISITNFHSVGFKLED